MARIARIVVPGLPHHVTQRGNRKEPVYFEDGDQLRYLAFLKEGMERSGTRIWAYCLMPNHVHLIAVPRSHDGLRALLSEAHRRYTRFINHRHGWSGHLWQGRFGSVAMDEDHLANAIAYVSLNPVRAGLVDHAVDWPFSSARAHMAGKSDGIVDVEPVLSRFPDFATFLAAGGNPEATTASRRAETSGRPLGSPEWLRALERRIGVALTPAKRGPKAAMTS